MKQIKGLYKGLRFQQRQFAALGEKFEGSAMGVRRRCRSMRLGEKRNGRTESGCIVEE